MYDDPAALTTHSRTRREKKTKKFILQNRSILEFLFSKYFFESLPKRYLFVSTVVLYRFNFHIRTAWDCVVSCGTADVVTSADASRVEWRPLLIGRYCGDAVYSTNGFNAWSLPRSLHLHTAFKTVYPIHARLHSKFFKSKSINFPPCGSLNRVVTICFISVTVVELIVLVLLWWSSFFF